MNCCIRATRTSFDADLSKILRHHSTLRTHAVRGSEDRRQAHAAFDQNVLKVPVEERDEKGKKRLTGGKGNDRGTPQGGVISPLLANLYMNRMLKGWRQTGRRSSFGRAS